MRLALAQLLGCYFEGSAGHGGRVSVLQAVTDTHSIFSQESKNRELTRGAPPTQAVRDVTISAC